MKSEAKKLLYFGGIIILVFILHGIRSGINFIVSIWEWIKFLLKSLDFISIQFNDGNGILTLLFAHPIIYFVVGGIFWLFPVRKKIGKIFGKVCYWLTSVVISATLNYISSKIFIV